MLKRVFILLILIFVRIIIGSLFLVPILRTGQIMVSGKVINVTQTDSKCIIEIGVFIATRPLPCSVNKNIFINVVGSPSINLIGMIRGKIDLAEAQFDIAEKMPISVTGPTLRSGFFEAIRNYCRVVYQRFLPRDEAALLAGIVLGDKENIGQDFYLKMVNSGTIHIAVASGYNLMLVGGTTLSLLFWLVSRKWATVVAITVMIFYTVLAGFEPPVVRALTMSSLLFVSAVVGRKIDSVWFLFLSAWAMLIWDPGLLWSVSFQLSIMASVGLMIVSPWLTNWLVEKGFEKETLWLEKGGAVTTMCTMFATAPIIWWQFGRISLIGLFSNIFILPLVPPVMVLGVFTLVAPNVFFVPTYALLHLMVRIIGFFGM